MNGNYDRTEKFHMKPNAFVQPNNPKAIFPQVTKPNIVDFRSHKMIGGGLTSANNFRKMYSTKAKKSKSLKPTPRLRTPLRATEIREMVHEYLSRDDNSRIMPGKKDCRTDKGVTMQKRYVHIASSYYNNIVVQYVHLQV